METFKLIENEMGAINSVLTSTGLDSANAEAVYAYFNNNPKSEIYAGERLHKLAVAFKSLELNFRILSKARNGEILKIKINSSTLVDVTKWNLNLDEIDLEDLYVDGRLPSTPAGLVINEYKASMFSDDDSANKASASKMSFMEAVLCSKKIPTEGFKPAYSGGLVASPASPRAVYTDVISYDISSSYPWSALTSLVPVGSAQTVPKSVLERIVAKNGEIKLGRDLGFIGLFSFRGLKKKDWVRIPMIKVSDEQYIEDAIWDNDGLVYGDARLALSTYDLKALSIQYDWDSLEVLMLEVHKLGRIPDGAHKYLVESYEKKENASTPVDRMKAKTAINTVIGLWGIDPFSASQKDVFGDEGSFITGYSRDIDKSWRKYVGQGKESGHTSGGKRTWDFRWAVYTLAAARLRIVELESKLHHNGFDILYCDTDSIKFKGSKSIANVIFKQLNEDVIMKNEELSIPETMGQWVDESESFKKVVFRGKKFYACEDDDGKVEGHIAGVYKDHANKIFDKITLTELALLSRVSIHTTRPSIAMIENDPFGAKYQELNKPVVFKF